MRKIITTVYCDRCKTQLKSLSNEYAITLFKAKDQYTTGDPKEFCPDCTRSFYNWLKQGRNMINS